MEQRLAVYDELADLLLSLSDGGLTKKLNNSYMVLELEDAIRDSNKNAVSLIRDGVSFMCSDWKREQEAQSKGLRAERSRNFPRLQFPDLTKSEILTHKEFFAALTNEARQESERLQTLHLSGKKVG